MSTLHDFDGTILDETNLILGEGPTYDPATDTAWWFSILACELHELVLSSGVKRVHPLPAMGSVLGRIDADRQIIATENGLYLREIASGKMTLVTPIEAGRSDTRSNDGRIHPSGALWVGTMSKHDVSGAGAIYHVLRGEVTVIVPKISIPNGICFSPDGTVGYWVDSMVNHYMRVPLDPATGMPTGEPQIFSDESGHAGVVDGSVCDANGTIYNARWEAGEVHVYQPDGRKTDIYKVPAMQATCPAFIGANADRLLVTSAWQGLSEAQRKQDSLAGATFELGIKVNGVFDAPYAI